MRHSRYLAERIPGARYVELEGVDNLPGAVDSSDEIVGEIEEFLTGGRSRTVARDLLTVIFSDIVGSTGHAARLGDARWRDLLGAHQTAVRREIDRFGGREVKTIGDGFLIAFDGAPSQARALRAGDRRARSAPLGLEVRVGLHTGECEVIGDDVGGMAVHIAARVAALAAPGEVLASGTDVRDGRRRRAEVRGPRHAGAQGRAGALAAVRAGRRAERSETCRPQPSRWLSCWGA